MKLAGHDPYDV